MEFILELVYKSNNVVHRLFTDRPLSNNNIKLRVEGDESNLIIKVDPKYPIRIKSCKLTTRKSYDSTDKVFSNGYQSWSPGFEHSVTDHVRGLNNLPKQLINHYAFESYGDYRFYNYRNSTGLIHSNNYTFIRQEGEIELIGSLNERVAYTIFEHDTTTSNLYVYKDFDGVEIDSECELYNIISIFGNEDEVFDKYFQLLQIPKPLAKPVLGYTSWYNYYQEINEDIIVKDLEAITKSTVHYDVFQIDDGFESKVGDWFDIDKTKFKNGLKPIVNKIHQAKMKAGIWLAPLIMEADSKLFKEHPEWAVTDENNNPIKAGCNWSGSYGLNFSLAEVKQYVSDVLDYYLGLGFDFFKLDFLYATAIFPYNNQSRSQIMYEAMEFLRFKLKDKLILGCGVNLFTAFGLVDYCRVSCDVSLSFDDKIYMRLLHQERPSTKNAIKSVIYRRHLNNRAFLNDPDVFLLRKDNIQLSKDQKIALLKLNSIFGSVLFTSDNVADYNDKQIELLNEAINLEITDLKVFNDKGYIVIKYKSNNENFSLRYDPNKGKLVNNI